MAKKTATRGGKPLVIVESPAKARTISRFLGREFTIEASIGHVRDLPEGAKQIPAQYKGEPWAYLGVNVDRDFEPIYIIPPGKTEQVRKLKGLVKEASELYLATDEDREGEAISWHLCQLLSPKVPVRRLVFHEITEEAIREALEHPREVNDDLVRAQETRRILDRLYGYEVSPLLWRKVRPRLSAGRVQSVAVRLIVDRERERMAFKAATYWDLLGTFHTGAGGKLQATMTDLGGKRLAASRDFDQSTGKLKDPALLLLDERAAREAAVRLAPGEYRVKAIDEKPYTSKPAPPFTTSTLQQEANRKLGFTARRTMQVAQALYENGHITYMRTDSTTLANVAVEAARDLVRSRYGAEFLPTEARSYRTKVKNAQEAHEAIRPAGHPFATPEEMRGQLNDDELKLYDLIWKRTIASQMADCRGRRTSVSIAGPEEARFQVGGKTIDFPGFLRAYVEGADDPQAELADQETLLPPLVEGEKLRCEVLEPKSHTTQPPARFTEATLTRTLEEFGIGRPSTYAAIIETILSRDYVFKRSNALVPTWLAFAVCRLMENHLEHFVDYAFTARMEDDLDAISRGETGHVDYLRRFYFGNGHPGLKKQLERKIDEIDARAISRISIGTPTEGPFRDEIVVRVGRYGPFIEQGERRASLPDGLAPDELSVEKALEMLAQGAQAAEPIGYCPETGKPVYLKVGRFGPYVQRGTPEDDEKPQNASLLRGMKAEDVDLDMALKLLSLPRNLGPHPESGDDVIVANGRFGPFVRCGSETRSLSADLSPLDVTLEQALALLATPKAARRGFGARREPLRVLGESPVTKEAVQVFDGRYGPYVTDGTTNASVPKDASVEELSLDAALALLAARAAAGGGSRRGRKAAPKKAAKTATKKAPKKAAKKSGRQVSVDV